MSVAAPGVGLLTTKAGGGYEAVTGTSGSAALVSGVVGLLKTVRPRLGARRAREMVLEGARRVAVLYGRAASGGVLSAAPSLGAAATLPPDGGADGEGEAGAGGEKAERANAPSAPARGMSAAGPQGANVPAPNVGSGNLPDLNEARRERPAAPNVLRPVPSARRRCPPQNPFCNGDAPSPRPNAGRLISRHGWSEVLLAAYTVPASAFYGGATYSVTDAPTVPLLPWVAAAALLGAPTGLSVTSTSDALVRIEWDGVAGAVGYQVERSLTKAGPYDTIAYPDGTSFNDTSVSRGNTYLYRVVAVDASGLVSAPSNTVFGTAVTFADDPLIAVGDPQGRPATNVKAAHVNDLRTAVDAVRVAADLGRVTWPEAVGFGVPVRASHVAGLRTSLDEALVSLGITPAAHADTPLAGAPNGTPVRKIHFEQLRARSARGVLAGGGGPAAGEGTGLTGTYFQGAAFETYKLTRADSTVNFDWGTGSPDPSVPADNFSARWTGALLPRFSETYTFHVTSSDGVRLWVDGHPVIDNWSDHEPTVNTGTYNLVAGRKHAVTMEFYERAGVARAA